RLNALFDDVSNGLRWIEPRFLFEKADGESRRDRSLALKILIDARKNPKQRTFSRPVQSNDADLCAIEVRQVDIFEDSFLIVVLADPNHGVDDFVGDGAHLSLDANLAGAASRA